MPDARYFPRTERFSPRAFRYSRAGESLPACRPGPTSCAKADATYSLPFFPPASCSLRAQLIVVDCDMGNINGCKIEPLPAPVRRTLTQAVRAVLHGNLGSLDSAIRLSKPQSGGGALPAVNGADAAGHAKSGGQRGGERSSEAGDGDGRKQNDSGAGNGGGTAEGGAGSSRKPLRRGRQRGAAARAEALLRLEFARAMADMLYGFTECLFFLHPERPIFNGARFLQVWGALVSWLCVPWGAPGVLCGLQLGYPMCDVVARLATAVAQGYCSSSREMYKNSCISTILHHFRVKPRVHSETPVSIPQVGPLIGVENGNGSTRF